MWDALQSILGQVPDADEQSEQWLLGSYSSLLVSFLNKLSKTCYWNDENVFLDCIRCLIFSPAYRGTISVFNTV